MDEVADRPYGPVSEYRSRPSRAVMERAWHGPPAEKGTRMSPVVSRQQETGLASARLDISVLGPLRVRRADDPIHLGGPKPQTVFAVLVAAAGRSVSADALIDALWGEDPPASARATLQSHVSKLRSVLGETVVWEGGAYRLDVARGEVDSWRFEDGVAAARDLLSSSDPGGAARRLAEALATWRGHPFSGLPPCAPLEMEARRLEELRLQAVEDRIDAELALGNHAELAAQLETLTAEHPLRERLVGQHMLALYRSGRQGDALRAYTRLRETLVEELGIDPSVDLRRLHDRILQQDPALELRVVTGDAVAAFLFTDIEGSTPLWESDPDAMSRAVAQQDRIITSAVEDAGGRVVARNGDALDAVFVDVGAAVAAAVRAQVSLQRADWEGVPALRVRMAVDVGEVEVRGERYHGPVLNRLGRILAAGHGGQVLLSADAAATIPHDAGFGTVPLGEYRFKGIGRPQAVHQLVADGLDPDFPSLRLDRGPVDRGGPVVQVRGYELREVLGEGDFGVVHRAYQPSVGREVAVKVIRGEYANQPGFIRRFEAEARFIAQLEHPHIVGLHDFWREPEGAYLVMPYLRGGSLGEALRRGPWNVGPALRLLDQVGAALSYAHRSGVVHRDVKPGNVLLDDDGNAYLSDFGIAVRETDDANGVVTSSLSYVAPEELRGEELGPQADLFSLGVLTFTLLTGVHAAGRDLPPISEARPDLPSALDEVLRTATADQPAARYERVEDYLRALRQALGADVVTVVGSEHDRGTNSPVRNPYKGLRAFQDTDAADFHGRETLVDELVQAVAQRRLVAVVGASGSGKSSIVRAGLIPALRAGRLPGSRGWLSADMFPGSYPFEELESALLRVAVDDPGSLVDELRSDELGLLRVVKRILPRDDSELVLVIDQFEELFSLVDDASMRRSFLRSLEALAADERGRVRVVLTLRADFLDGPLDHPGFGELVKAGLVPVTPPSQESLGQAISRPARAVGLDLEPGLVGEIIADVQEQPGALPLLQYALTELFQRRDDGRLTIAAYRATGGVLGALGRRAEELYEGLPADGRAIARQVFLRLVTIDDETDDTRRRVSQSELESLDLPGDLLETVLSQYATYRLLTFDRDTSTRIPTVEVAHEALIREWPRLRGWIDEQRQHLILQRRLLASLREWSDAEEDASYLLRGGRLEQAERWTGESGMALSRQEERYLAESRKQWDDEQATARRRRRRVMVGLAVALVLVSVLAAVALVQSRVASAEARDADARRLAGAATAALDEDPERAILLALEAASLSRDAGVPLLPETVGALHLATQASRAVHRIDEGSTAVSFSADGSLLATNVLGAEGDPGTDVALWDVTTGERIGTLPGDGPVAGIAFSPTGSLLAVGTAARGRTTDGTGTTVTVWDGADQSLISRVEWPAFTLPPGANMTRPLAWSPDGSRIASVTGALGARSQAVTVWEARSGEEVVTVAVGSFATGLTFIDDAGTLLVMEAGESRVVRYDVTTGEELGELATGDVPVQNLVHDPRRDQVVVSSQQANVVQAWDLGSEDLRWEEAHAGGGVIAASPGSGFVALGGNSGLVRVLDLNDGTEIAAFTGHTASVWGGAFSPDGRLLAAVGTDGTTLVWDLSPTGPPEKGAVAFGHGTPFAATFSPDGTRALVASDGGALRLLDLGTGEVVRSIEDLTVDFFLPAPASPDWRWVATIDADGAAHVRDVETFAVVADLPACTSPRMFSPDGTALVLDGAWLFREFEHCDPDDPPPGAELRSRVVDVATGEELLDLGDRELFGPGHAFNPAGVFEAGRFLVVNDDALAVEIFDFEQGTELATLPFEGDHPLNAAFDPTGHFLAIGTQNGRTIVVDLVAVVDGADPWDAVVFDMTVGTGGIPGVSLNADGLLATTGFHGVLRLWDVPTSRLVADISIAADTWAFGFFTPDGRHLLHGDVGPGGDHLLRRFHLDPDELVALAESRVTRDLAPDECQRYILPHCA